MGKKILIAKKDVVSFNYLLYINSFKKNKIYHLHNIYGLGDSVFNLIFFNIISNFIVKCNIKIYYYAKSEYLLQLKEFIYSPNIFLCSLDYKPYFSIELWFNNDYFELKHSDQQFPHDYNNYCIKFFNSVLNKLHFNISINNIIYFDNDLITRYDNIPDKYKNFDILILNSQPFSGQYTYNKGEWDNYIISLHSQNFKILTTTKVDNLLCSSDDNLSIKDIASLSTKAKVVIAINSGVFPGLLNVLTLQNVKHFYIFDNRCYYSYPNFENKNNINDISVDELNNFVN